MLSASIVQMSGIAFIYAAAFSAQFYNLAAQTGI
jgi:hypothetical protein